MLEQARHPEFFEKNSQSFSRRSLLTKSFNGIGALGLAASLGQRVVGAESSRLPESSSGSPLTAGTPHFPARAKRVIHLWMNGAPSQVDTFDPKTSLAKFAGQRPESTVNLTTENATGGLMPSPFRFPKYGQSGIEISELFPHVARFADDLCVIRSMQTDVPVNESSNWMMFTTAFSRTVLRTDHGCSMGLEARTKTCLVSSYLVNRVNPSTAPQAEAVDFCLAFIKVARSRYQKITILVKSFLICKMLSCHRPRNAANST